MGLSLQNVLERLQRVTKDKLQDQVQKIVESDRKIVAYKQDRFELGLRPNGNFIGKYKSKSYELYKASLNPRAGGAVDLIRTGSFTNNLFVDGKGNRKFIFDSSDRKTKLLKGKYGDDIMGFNDEDWEELQRVDYAPKLTQYIKQITGL